MPLGQSNFAFMESQAAHIESRVRMIQYGYIQYPELVGISREASPHADVITYYSYDGSGYMIDVANRANDIPLVEVTEQQHNVPIHWKALAYDWSDREIGRARLLGQNLPDRKVRVAFRIAEEVKEQVFFFGDSAKGWDGLLNNSNVPTQAAAGAWDGATYRAIFRDINDLLEGVWTSSTQVRIADTLLLTPHWISRLGEPMGDDANMSILEYVKRHNVYTATTGRPLTIRSVRQLADSGVTPDAVAYEKNMDVLRYHIPQELQFNEPQRDGLVWSYIGTMVLAGLEIMEPLGIRYLTGID